MKNIIIAKRWVMQKLNASNTFIDKKDYCPTRDIFQERLDKIRIIIEKKYKKPAIIYPLIAIIGEIGNNAFDHNLGKWRDIAGIYFNLNLEEKIVVIADRGQGILSSIQKVKPNINTDIKAIRVAFTQKISGRFPEKRGNGLKFVVKVAQNLNFEIFLQSGNASAIIKNKNLRFRQEKENIGGVLAIIKFKL